MRYGAGLCASVQRRKAFQTAGAVVQQGGANERGFAGTARAPEEHVLAGLAVQKMVEIGE